MIKVYELKRFDGLQLKTSWCNQSLTVEFKGGNARQRATLTTANMFVQDALEHDPRFGTLYVLKQSYEDTPVEREKAAEQPKRRVTKVKTVNDALRWLTEAGFNPTGEGDLEDLMDKAGVEFPNLKK